MTDLVDIKQRLIDRISDSDDKKLLLAVEEMLSTAGVVNEIYELSYTEKELLELSDQDIRNGRIITEEDLDSLDSGWMGEE